MSDSQSQCCSNPPTVDAASGAGHVENLAGFNTYVSGSLESKLALLLVSDGFGYEAPNLRKLADEAAAAGFYVVVPDFFYGDPYVVDNPVPAWLNDHDPAKGFEDAKLIIDALKSKEVSPIGAAGFCWGAKVVVELSKVALIQAAVMLHPSFVTVDDIKSVKVPIAILGAEDDHMSPPELIEQFDEILKASEVRGPNAWFHIIFCLLSLLNEPGRNARGIITARHRGGGHKRLYRKIDFRRNEKDIYGRIVTIEYDPNRNAYICLIHYGDGEKRYILHLRGAIIGDTIVSGTEVPIKMGNALPLSAV
ncbi:hypothetical protein V6N13_065036 [Hibiscus sabdariffa]|uniref:Large ribosomal subunit protein uL2 RNA-binding domain-containing protein n=1 Tax=Hibiscus sabdariffa TaxID=183260 RepID=A0ABR2QS27_9ROSI